MKGREILTPFSSPMVLANMAGRKTATRRMSDKYGKVKAGDIILQGEALTRDFLTALAKYEADDALINVPWQWQRPRLPSIFMPRELVRARFKVTKDAYRQPVQEMTLEQTASEGIAQWARGAFRNQQGEKVNPIAEYAALWDSINGTKYPWASNPVVWVISYERVR